MNSTVHKAEDKGSIAGQLRRRVGAAGEVADAGIAWLERQAKKTADMDVPVLSGAAKALQPLYAGARAAIAHATSGSGKYYQPEVRDERYFSNDALRLMAKNLGRHGGKGMSRYDYGKPSPAMWEASQAVGGATVKDGKVTDVFDVDTKDPYGLSDGAHLVNGGLGTVVDLGHRALGLVFGDEHDPAAGKVRTEIPLSAIRHATEGVPGKIMDLDTQQMLVRPDGPYKPDPSTEIVRPARSAEAPPEVLRTALSSTNPGDYKYTDPLFTPDGQQRIKDIVGKTSPQPESDELTKGPDKIIPGWTPPDLNPKPYYLGANAEEEPPLTQADENGGDTAVKGDRPRHDVNRWGGNLRSEGRPLYLFRDDKGKITGYGTTESIVIPGVGEQAGQFVVAPTIVNGKKQTDEQAAAHYRESGEYWAAKPTAEEADRTAQEVHEDHARIYGPQWNEYIEAHPDELSEKLKAEIEESKKAEVRQDAEGGDVREDEIMTENPEIVNNAGDADIPVSNGPRIVINPSTFRNRKDALCVAFNERFRIAMEQYGFEPKSEPTERQRRFFADTAYADDETMLRRTILARILTLDTSVKDPTDEQLGEAMEFLGAFKENEEPETDFEARAIDKIANLVAAAYERRPGGAGAEPPESGDSVQAAAGGGQADDPRKRGVANGSGVQVGGRELTKGELAWQQNRALTGGSMRASDRAEVLNATPQQPAANATQPQPPAANAAQPQPPAANDGDMTQSAAPAATPAPSIAPTGSAPVAGTPPPSLVKPLATGATAPTTTPTTGTTAPTTTPTTGTTAPTTTPTTGTTAPTTTPTTGTTAPTAKYELPALSGWKPQLRGGVRKATRDEMKNYLNYATDQYVKGKLTVDQLRTIRRDTKTLSNLASGFTTPERLGEQGYGDDGFNENGFDVFGRNREDAKSEEDRVREQVLAEAREAKAASDADDRTKEYDMLTGTTNGVRYSKPTEVASASPQAPGASQGPSAPAPETTVPASEVVASSTDDKSRTTTTPTAKRPTVADNVAAGVGVAGAAASVPSAVSAIREAPKAIRQASGAARQAVGNRATNLLTKVAGQTAKRHAAIDAGTEQVMNRLLNEGAARGMSSSALSEAAGKIQDVGEGAKQGVTKHAAKRADKVVKAATRLQKSAGRMAALKAGAKALGKATGVAGAAMTAYDGAKMATREFNNLREMQKLTGATAGDVVKATGTALTTAEGWKNIGANLMGNIAETFGADESAKWWRGLVQDAKGGRTKRLKDIRRKTRKLRK
jgi:hypothetical protein